MKPNEPLSTGKAISFDRPQQESKMTPEAWDARDKKKNRDILLQVAFKAAVELACANKIVVAEVFNEALKQYNWLLSQTEGKTDLPEEPPIEAYENDPFNV